MPGDHRDRQVGHQLADAFEQLEPAHAGQLDVGDEQIPLLGLDAAHGVSRVELVRNLKAAELAQHPAHEPAESAIIVDEQYAPTPLTRLREFHEAPRPALRPAATPGPVD